MNKPITRESLTEAGYRTYPAGDKREVWQKTFRGGDHKKLYFLEFEFLRPASDRSFASATFYQPFRDLSGKDETRFRIELDVAPTATLSAVESFFVNTYTALGCIPDIHNND